MPLVAMSSSRPTNGLQYDAPTLAASSACVGEKISVALTFVPSLDSALHAGAPSRVDGTLTPMDGFLIVAVWPAGRGPIPDGVPVAITSPGSSVITRVM